MSPDLTLPHAGVLPWFAGRPVWCGRGSTVIGAVRLGVQAWIGDRAVIRADGQSVTAGERFWLGHHSTVHIATFSHGTVVGDRVTVGRNSVVHACTVGSDVVIEDDVVILDHAEIGDGAVIEAGATVFPRARLPGGFVYAGSPATARHTIGPEAVAERGERLRERMDACRIDEACDPPRVEDGVFVARNARLRGRVSLGAGSSVLFGCELDAEVGAIVVGADTNIQDNTVIRTRGAGVVIGRDTSIAHNVGIADSRIGARSLIGIGATIAPGTLIADDVLLAAGSATEPGQVLGSGHLWGGRPARILAPLDADRRGMMARIVEGYVRHGREYRAAQVTLG